MPLWANTNVILSLVNRHKTKGRYYDLKGYIDIFLKEQLQKPRETPHVLHVLKQWIEDAQFLEAFTSKLDSCAVEIAVWHAQAHPQSKKQQPTYSP
ncbi:hypothetical protein SERLA73DRAFT_164010, partial [Serpula lacrymans var. lacrymans S7.3]